jgi:hypothetical protein
MLIFLLFIVITGTAVTRLVNKAVDEYSYYGDSSRDWKHVDLFYYQASMLEKQSK